MKTTPVFLLSILVPGLAAAREEIAPKLDVAKLLSPVPTSQALCSLS
jgi:hypothetical protein